MGRTPSSRPLLHRGRFYEDSSDRDPATELVLMFWAMVICAMGVVIAVYPADRSQPDVQDDDHGEAIRIERSTMQVKQLLGDDEMIIARGREPEGGVRHPDADLYRPPDHRDRERSRRAQGRTRLTRADNIRGADGTVIADDLITALPKTPEDLARIERDTFENPLFVNIDRRARQEGREHQRRAEGRPLDRGRRRDLRGRSTTSSTRPTASSRPG